MLIKFLILFFLGIAPLLAEEDYSHMEKEYIILQPRDGGMFSIWMDVIAVVRCYDLGLYGGVHVDFETKGLYYDKEHGPNSWEYYCEPIDLGPKENPRIIRGGIPRSMAWIDRHITRHVAKAYIDKYIHIKKFILDDVSAFKWKHFQDYFIVGVHYRGLDKFGNESSAISYEDTEKEIRKAIEERTIFNYRIFVASDDQLFLNHMMKAFPNRVVYKNHERSSDGNPLHYKHKKPYYHGLEAVTDMLLLSKADLLIRTESNLSRWSTWFNPDMPEIVLNKFLLE